MSNNTEISIDVGRVKDCWEFNTIEEAYNKIVVWLMDNDRVMYPESVDRFVDTNSGEEFALTESPTFEDLKYLSYYHNEIFDNKRQELKVRLKHLQD